MSPPPLRHLLLVPLGSAQSATCCLCELPQRPQRTRRGTPASSLTGQPAVGFLSSSSEPCSSAEQGGAAKPPGNTSCHNGFFPSEDSVQWRTLYSLEAVTHRRWQHHHDVWGGQCSSSSSLVQA